MCRYKPIIWLWRWHCNLWISLNPALLYDGAWKDSMGPASCWYHSHCWRCHPYLFFHEKGFVACTKHIFAWENIGIDTGVQKRTKPEQHIQKWLSIQTSKQKGGGDSFMRGGSKLAQECCFESMNIVGSMRHYAWISQLHWGAWRMDEGNANTCGL